MKNYKIIKSVSHKNFRINILEHNNTINEDIMATLIFNIIINSKFTSYEINDKDIMDVLVDECDNRTNAKGFDLNNGSEFELITNKFLVDKFEHLQLTKGDLFVVDSGIDVLTYNNRHNKLNISEVKSSAKKSIDNQRDKNIFIKKIKESLESQLCKKRKTGKQTRNLIKVSKNTFDKNIADSIIDILKTLNKNSVQINNILPTIKENIELNSFIWCSSSLNVDINDIKNLLSDNTDKCVFCGKAYCKSYEILNENNIIYNLYINRFADKFDFKSYLEKLSAKLKEYSDGL